MDIKPDLGDQRISKRKLSESEASYRELADTENTDTKLGDGKDAITELADCDDSLCDDWYTVRTIFKGNMNEGQAEQDRFGFVLVTPSVPFVPCGEWRSAVRTGKGLIRNFMPTLSAGFNISSFFDRAFTIDCGRWIRTVFSQEERRRIFQPRIA